MPGHRSTASRAALRIELERYNDRPLSREAGTRRSRFIELPIRTKILWFTLKPSMHQNPVRPLRRSGCFQPPMDIKRLPSHTPPTDYAEASYTPRTAMFFSAGSLLCNSFEWLSLVPIEIIRQLTEAID
jgi:hypothetical protein